MTLTADGSNIASILSEFRGDPQKAGGLAELLGFEPIPNPEDRLAGALSGGLKQFLRGRGDGEFGVKELYRVGSCKAAPAEAGLWVGVLSDWGYRASDRDRSRRRIARSLVEHVPDRRSLALLVPPAVDPRHEAELIFPRVQTGAGSGAVTSIRAHLDLDNPTRFHRDLLRDLRVPPGASLLEVSSIWHRQFSVERVTTKFYQEYADVRDRMAEALVAHNRDHPVVKFLAKDREARAWATRQMGRVLFLWFLQAKQWLGEPGGMGSVTYLLDLWERRAETQEGEYYRGILAPMFFDAMATGSSSQGENPVLGFVPYLNGGLFRRNALEDRIHDAGEVSLPDDVFDPGDDNSLLGLLSRYRFTTRESTPDDQSVDPDPELLGRVFENLYQGDERHDTGTYYTPREIVHFMCREALDGYLRDETGVDQTTLDALRQEAVGSRDEYQPLPDIPVNDLVDALETVRVCDPAVGSGAFLLGTIQEIVALRRGILFSQRRYVEPDELYRTVSAWKRRTIENSLYGVDINPEAVEICRLRLWLSMVLDMDEPPPANSDWALPNLDFQIVAGDSLVDRVTGVTLAGAWPPQVVTMELGLRRRIDHLVSNILSRRREFERTQRNPRRLRELRDLIARDQRETIQLHLQNALEKAKADLAGLKESPKATNAAVTRATKQVTRLTSLLDDIAGRDFVLVQKPFLWSIAFPEVLREGDTNAGFDIVLANPPYVRMEKLDNEDELSYGEAFPEVSASRADLLVYFYARALQVLRAGGWLAFITSNKFMRAGYGAGTREHLPASLRIQRVIDFGDLPLFEANGKAIAAYPAMVVGSRSEDTEGHALKVAELAGPVRKALSSDGLKVNAESVRGVLEDLDGLLAKAEVDDFPQVMLKKDGWVLEDPTLIRLFERLMSQGTPLGEFVRRRIYYGVKTGLNEAFVIDQDKRDELIGEDPRSAELIKPWLRGQDIKRWRSDRSGLYVIFTRRGVDIDQYPAIRDHLGWFTSDLEGRATAHLHPWYELQQPQEGIYHEFANPKIVWGNLAIESKFARDLTQAYVSAPANFLIEPTPWLLAVMNSSLLNFLYPRLTVARGHSFQEFKIGYIEPTPIVAPEGETREILETLTAHVVRHVESREQVKAIENEIDTIVFDIYGVRPRERKIVLDWLDERREALGAEMPPDWRKLNALRATAGAWKNSIDGEQLKRDIRASRDIHTRPVPRL